MWPAAAPPPCGLASLAGSFCLLPQLKVTHHTKRVTAVLPPESAMLRKKPALSRARSVTIVTSGATLKVIE